MSNPKYGIDVVLSIDTFSASVLFRSDLDELCLPVSEHVGFFFDHVSDFADRVIQLRDSAVQHDSFLWVLWGAPDAVEIAINCQQGTKCRRRMYIDFPSFAPSLEMPLNQSFLSHWKSEAKLVFVVTVWGSNFVVIKLVLDVMHPHVMNIFRILSAGLFLGYAHHTRQKSLGQGFFEPVKQYPFELIRIGLIGWVFYQIAFIVGLNHTTAGSAAIIMASLPLWTALLSALLLKERLNRVMWLGLVLSISGTFVVVLSGNQNVDLGSEYLLGNLVILLAALLWGVNTVYTKSLVDRVTPIGITMLGLLVSIPFLAAVSIPYWDLVEWERINWLVWVAILFSGGLSTGIAIVLWNGAVKIMGPSHTAAFQNLVPVVALITALVVLDEAILFAQIIGVTLTIGGLFVMRRGRESERTQVSDTH